MVDPGIFSVIVKVCADVYVPGAGVTTSGARPAVSGTVLDVAAV